LEDNFKRTALYVGFYETMKQSSYAQRDFFAQNNTVVVRFQHKTSAQLNGCIVVVRHNSSAFIKYCNGEQHVE